MKNEQNEQGIKTIFEFLENETRYRRAYDNAKEFLREELHSQLQKNPIQEQITAIDNRFNDELKEADQKYKDKYHVALPPDKREEILSKRDILLRELDLKASEWGQKTHEQFDKDNDLFETFKKEIPKTRVD